MGIFAKMKLRMRREGHVALDLAARLR